MNLAAFLNRGAAHAPRQIDRQAQAVLDNAEKARASWLNALLVDQTRSWMSLGETRPDLLGAMATMLTISGFVHVFEAKTADTPDLRVIRGAISAAEQCQKAGAVLRVEDVRAFTSACQRAEKIIASASVAAIVHAAQSIKLVVEL